MYMSTSLNVSDLFMSEGMLNTVYYYQFYTLWMSLCGWAEPCREPSNPQQGRMEHRCEEGGIVKEVATCVDKKTGSQLLWGKGWFRLVYGGKCTVSWIFDMYSIYINKIPITQVRQLAVYTGVHLIGTLPMMCQWCAMNLHYWVIHNRLCLQ